MADSAPPPGEAGASAPGSNAGRFSGRPAAAFGAGTDAGGSCPRVASRTGLGPRTLRRRKGQDHGTWRPRKLGTHRYGARGAAWAFRVATLQSSAQRRGDGSRPRSNATGDGVVTVVPRPRIGGQPVLQCVFTVASR